MVDYLPPLVGIPLALVLWTMYFVIVARTR
jgi:hypothetical protein